MNAEEKKDRRTARHQVQAALKRVVLHKVGLYSTGGQIRQSIRTLTDRYFAEQVRPAARAIEAQALNQPSPVLSDGLPPESPLNG